MPHLLPGRHQYPKSSRRDFCDPSTLGGALGLGDVGNIKDVAGIYAFVTAFEQKNLEMMPTSADYWCEHRYYQYAWNDHYQIPTSTCNSPRYTALGLQSAPVWTNGSGLQVPATGGWRDLTQTQMVQLQHMTIHLVRTMTRPTHLKKTNPTLHVKRMQATHAALISASCFAQRRVDIVLPLSMRVWRGSESRSLHCFLLSFSRPVWKRQRAMALQQPFRFRTTILCFPSYPHWMERKKATSWNALTAINNRRQSMPCILTVLTIPLHTVALTERLASVPSKVFMERQYMQRCSLKAASSWRECRR